MLVNVCIIEAGGMVGATSQKYIICLFVAALQTIRILNGHNPSFTAHLMNFQKLLYNKMHMEMKQEVWWVQSMYLMMEQ